MQLLQMQLNSHIFFKKLVVKISPCIFFFFGTFVVFWMQISQIVVWALHDIKQTNKHK